jgi:23S rRNA (guanosine2251-2'-O)-methyltransferase
MKNYLFGRNPVREWLTAGLYGSKIFITPDSGGAIVQEIRVLAAARKIPVEMILKMQLTQLVGHDNHQGLAIEIELPPYVEVEEILQQAVVKGEHSLIALLDGIQDPHNLGAIIRTADGAGFHGVIIPKDNCVGLTPTVFKTSAGAAAHVPVAQVTNLVRTMKLLKDKGLWLFGADENAPKKYFQADYKSPAGIVLGSEGYGLRRLVKENCDFLVSIPMFGKINSLNVSVAAGLLFFEAKRQRM